MNYKIRITAENQAIVKRIADENNMNPSNYTFEYCNFYYTIIDNKFNNVLISDYTELSTDQFIELFDKKESLVGRWFQALEDNAAGAPTIKNSYYQIKEDHQEGFLFLVPTFSDPNFLFGLSKEQENKHFKLMPKDFQPTQETELDKWLKETKAKNLSFNQLWEVLETSSHENIWKKLDGNTSLEKTQILFNQWGNLTEESPKVETEWQPKRGDKVLVWDNEESSAEEKIFLVEIKGCKLPIRVVAPDEETKFLQGQIFSSSGYKHMKPLPIEQPKETDFKSKVIEFIEKRIEDYNNWININISDKNYSYAYARQSINEDLKDLLTQIKEL